MATSLTKSMELSFFHYKASTFIPKNPRKHQTFQSFDLPLFRQIGLQFTLWHTDTMHSVEIHSNHYEIYREQGNYSNLKMTVLFKGNNNIFLQVYHVSTLLSVQDVSILYKTKGNPLRSRSTV